MKLKYLFFVLALLIMACATVKTEKHNSKDADKVLYYALPKTMLNVTVEVEKKILKRAKYEDFADGFGMVKKPTGSETTFSIKSVSATTVSKLDKGNVFQTQIIDGFLNKADFKNEYSENGELTTSKTTVENQGIQFATSTIKFATGLFFGTPKGGVEVLDKECENLTLLECCLKKHVPENERQIVREAISKLELLNGQLVNIESRAEDFTNLEVFHALIKEVEAKKKKIMETYFVSKKDTKATTLSFLVDPDSLAKETDGTIAPKDLVLLSLSKEGVIVDNDSKFNQAVWDQTNFKAKAETSATMQVVLKLETDNAYAKTINPNNALPNEASFYYRIPSLNTLRAYVKNTETEAEQLKYVLNNIQLTQFGRVVGAPSKLGEVNFALYPKTGALKSITGKAATANLEQLSGLQNQVLSTSDAIKGEDPIDAEIKRLEKEIKLKELQKKIGELEENEN